ncbi:MULTISPECIES: Fur family transcriptional regulator [unclassified Lebetimonas]|uniref:Fur family transcriptional regulator n=1 Tax=unclassified Lebetimonas TaxID=2648158 RepID=UPI0004645BEF|nr:MULTISPECIES: transcriptional repressor [unclassified Lebetimonas]
MKNIKNILDNSTLKTTPQRLAILKELENQGHASIEEIYEKIKEMFPSISLATIYKNITSLKEEGIISEVCLHQKPKYELSKEDHAHFICKNCGRVIDVPLNKSIINDIEEKFPDTQKELYIYGICEECKKEMKNK